MPRPPARKPRQAPSREQMQRANRLAGTPKAMANAAKLKSGLQGQTPLLDAAIKRALGLGKLQWANVRELCQSAGIAPEEAIKVYTEYLQALGKNPIEIGDMARTEVLKWNLKG